jgi:uncharacterized protein YrrD
MLRSIKELIGYKLATARGCEGMMGFELFATDGVIGTVSDFLFDEARWTVRWIVADTGGWLTGRKVLVSPISLGDPDWQSKVLPVRMTKAEIESAPGLGSDEPVTREYESRYFAHYGWPNYWTGGEAWGAAPSPVSLLSRKEKAEKLDEAPEAGPNVLRSAQEVLGYRIQAIDAEIGHVEDFVVDDESWTLRYMAIDTRNWLPGRKVVISPDWIESVEWTDRKVSVGLTREAVKGSPAYNPHEPVNREYEARLYDYYGRPAYW